MSRFSDASQTFKLAVLKTDPEATLPSKAKNDPYAAGYDLYLPRNTTDLIIPGTQPSNIPSRKAFNLKIKTSFPRGYVGLVRDRGSTGSQGIITLAGVVDSDYRGEWIIWLANLNILNIILNVNKAIAQVLFIPIETAEVIEVTELEDTLRGEGRLGSSDT